MFFEIWGVLDHRLVNDKIRLKHCEYRQELSAAGGDGLLEFHRIPVTKWRKLLNDFLSAVVGTYIQAWKDQRKESLPEDFLLAVFNSIKEWINREFKSQRDGFNNLAVRKQLDQAESDAYRQELDAAASELHRFWLQKLTKPVPQSQIAKTRQPLGRSVQTSQFLNSLSR